MAELNRIQPAQRIKPPLQDQHVNRKKKNTDHHKSKRKPEQQNDQDHKVDEYI
jgi:hypothetical protein